MNRLSLVMAVSKDGFVARSEDDNMKWLGSEDKQIFKMLTIPNYYCCAGSTTYKYLPELKNRKVYRVTRNPTEENDRTIEQIGYFEHAEMTRHNVVCLGGPTIAEAFLKSGDLRFDDIFICRSNRYCFEGIPWRLQPLIDEQYTLVDTFKFNEVSVEYYNL